MLGSCSTLILLVLGAFTTSSAAQTARPQQPSNCRRPSPSTPTYVLPCCLPAWPARTPEVVLRPHCLPPQQDTSGLAIVLLTALVEKQWVEEDVLARDLNLPPKMVRKAMRYFEQEQLLQREHKKEGKRARKRERELMVQAGLRPAPGQDGGEGAVDAEEEDEGIVSGRIISYCALDYPRILDSVRWRLSMMKKNWQV
eukprot:GHRQ01025418.1.p1 GENE.GHRQ01025418.1~~GHRQ01025418.1.p1  ORF type:complete len:198 (+),score=65.22 GHRQ01025418.1:149-742(+)